MNKFGFSFQQATVTTSFKTAGIVTAAAAAASGVQVRRGMVEELDLGQEAAPNATDCDVQWDVSRQTAANALAGSAALASSVRARSACARSETKRLSGLPCGTFLAAIHPLRINDKVPTTKGVNSKLLIVSPCQ